MHVGDAAELALQRCRQNDDGDLRTLAAKCLGYVCAELAGAEMVVEHRDVNGVQLGLGLFGGTSRDYLVSLLAQDGRAQNEVLFAVVEQQDANWRDQYCMRPGGAWWSRIRGVFGHRAVRSAPGRFG